MVLDKLITQGSQPTPVDEVKKTLRLLNSYLESTEDLPSPKQLLKRKVFPVRYPNGIVELCSSTVNFAIADRKHLLDLFSTEAKFLDFDINEIANIEPFLRWTGLENRYLSCSVKEISTLHGDSHRSLTSADRNISRKAYGLLRCVSALSDKETLC
jgi:hypothetical protein